MSKLTVIFGSFIVAVFLFSQLAEAAVVEVDVTVKAVDVKARGITVTYETKLGQKSIDLDVSRKAEITINGESGTLESVKPGQKAKVVFEKELQVVTQIIATGKGSDPGREVYRLTLQLSEFGDGKLCIEKTPEPPKDDFKGMPFKFSTWPHTKATKGKDGMFRLVHDFADPDDLGGLALNPPANVTIERTDGLLVFKSGPLPGGGAVKTGAKFEYGKRWRLPLKIIVDVVEHGDASFAIQVCDPPRKIGLLQCILASGTQDIEHPVGVEVNWIEWGEGGKINLSNFCKKKDVTLEQPFEKQFRLPVPNAKISDPMCLNFARLWGDKTTKVSRLEVRGRLSPMIGLSLAEKQGMVFAGGFVPNSLAEKAGFQIGDILSAINGKKPQTMLEAVDLLSRLPIGEEVVFTVRRGEDTEEIRVVAE